MYRTVEWKYHRQKNDCFSKVISIFSAAYPSRLLKYVDFKLTVWFDTEREDWKRDLSTSPKIAIMLVPLIKLSLQFPAGFLSINFLAKL